jgi:hypothetical protein
MFILYVRTWPTVEPEAPEFHLFAFIQSCRELWALPLCRKGAEKPAGRLAIGITGAKRQWTAGKRSPGAPPALEGRFGLLNFS